jgi:hypothetical protein
MKKHLFIFIGLATISALSVAWATGVEVKENKNNIIASRLVGSWLADNTFEKRLGKPHGLTELTFTKDLKAAALVSEKWTRKLKDLSSTVYSSGYFTIISKAKSGRPIKGHYLLTTLNGNPCLLMFMSRGNPEGMYIMLIPSTDKAKDILFVGGDRADEVFAAFHRKK